ncbi:MAG TPA: CBS domain-containing protein [Lysobacter sp.]|nr:CBS domain-containing protein [Lysobacter sp.]
MRNVRHLLEAKAPEIFSIGPDAPVIDAVRLMAEKGIGALLVMDATQLVGILSERDYARKIVLQGRSSSNTPVREIMTSDVISVGCDDTIDHCMEVVTGKRIRHLPVVRAGEVVGVVSIGDLVKAVIEDQQLELDQLQRYIAS